MLTLWPLLLPVAAASGWLYRRRSEDNTQTQIQGGL